jgi:AcrR family transcriptional regulator
MKAKTRKRVSKNEWLAQALEVLSTEGVQGVRIERLARNLKISKSGFYWHFRDRRELLSQVLDYWAYEFTEVVIQYQELLNVDPESRLDQISSMIRKHNLTKFDLSIRAWAEHDEMAAKMVSQVYQSRLGYLRETFRELGFKGDELEMRTLLFVCYHSWEMSMYGDEPERKLARLQKLRIKLLTKQ